MPDVFSGTRVEAIPGTPLPYGLTSGATVIDVIDPHELNGVEWQPLSCGEVGTTDWCVTPASADKVFDSSEVVRAEPIGVYHAYKCPPIGQTEDEDEDAARAGLAIGEQRALEAWFMTNVLAVDAVDVTPVAGTPVDTVQAVSLLEAALAINYGGVGVLHATAGSSAFLARYHQLVLQGARYRTQLGNWTALGAGYELANVGPGPTPAGPGQAWMYITGPVIARREPVAIIPGGNIPQVIDTVLNDRYVLAERVWVVGYECYVAAVLVETVL